MSQSNYIGTMLNLKDKSIHFEDKCVEEKSNGELVFYTLTYSHVCGAVKQALGDRNF